MDLWDVQWVVNFIPLYELLRLCVNYAADDADDRGGVQRDVVARGSHTHEPSKNSIAKLVDVELVQRLPLFNGLLILHCIWVLVHEGYKQPWRSWGNNSVHHDLVRCIIIIWDLHRGPRVHKERSEKNEESTGHKQRDIWSKIGPGAVLLVHSEYEYYLLGGQLLKLGEFLPEPFDIVWPYHVHLLYFVVNLLLYF